MVWEGRSREAPPYPDRWLMSEAAPDARGDSFLGQTRRDSQRQAMPVLTQAV